MQDERPVHVPNAQYPEIIYPGSPAPPAPAQHQESDIHLLDYWRVIVARRWTIYAVLATTVVVTMIATFKQTPIFQATTNIQIDRENPNILSFKDVYEIESQNDDTLQTQYKVLSSRSLARRVVETLKLDQIDEFGAAPPSLFSSYMASLEALVTPAKSATDEPDRVRTAIDAYLKKLGVAPVRQARLVNITFDSKDPELAARVINTHSTQFIEQNLQFKYDATQDASEFLSKRLVGLKSSLEQSEDRLQEYSRNSQILFTEEGKNTATEKLRQVEAEYTTAQGDRFQKESLDRIARSIGPDALPQINTNALVATLTARLAELQREESELAVTFGPEYPSRKRIRGQVEEIQRTLVTEKAKVVKGVQAEYQASVERERLLAGELGKQKQEVNRINQEIIQYNILKREVDSNKQLYDGLLTRLKEAGIAAGLKASNVRVVDRAEVPQRPISPRKSLNLLLSIVGGLVFGIGLAFFQEYMDSSLKSSEDVSRYLKLPTLGMIPKLQSLAGSKKYGYGYGHSQAIEKAEARKPIELTVHDSPNSLMSESYRSVRTSFLLSAADHPPRSMIVTSAVPSEGKTVTAINTAISLTQTGSKVVIVDADMRKPRIHNVFSLKAPAGLSSFLTGSAPLKDVIHPTEVPNLFVIPCGAVPPNPAELILSSRLKKMVEVLQTYFDFVIIDTPPLMNVSDARVLSSACDASLLVIKANATSRHLVKQAADNLSQSTAHLIGVVLNDVDVRSGSGYYPYYSGKHAYYSYSQAGSSKS